MRLAPLVLLMMAVPAAAQPAKAKWAFHESRDPMTDEMTALLSRPANEGKASLSIGCVHGNTSVMIDWAQFLSTEDIRVTHRLDSQPAVDSEWSISSDHRATIFPFDKTRDLARGLSMANRLMARVTPYGEVPVTVTFSLAGLTEALPRLKPCFF
jgi:type VI secretion system protein VasI